MLENRAADGTIETLAELAPPLDGDGYGILTLTDREGVVRQLATIRWEMPA